MPFADEGRDFDGSVLLTQCLQRDFLDPQPPSPNRLHVGARMVQRVRGDGKSPDRLANFIRAVYTAPGCDNATVLNVRDWHDQSDPGQAEELKFFGAHGLADTPGAEFIDPLGEYAFTGDVRPIDSIHLNDFVETNLARVLEELTGGHYDRWRFGVIGAHTSIKVELVAILLRTQLRVPVGQVAVCGNLCADQFLDRHNAALDKLGTVYGVKIFNTGDLNVCDREIAAFGRWLGLKA